MLKRKAVYIAISLLFNGLACTNSLNQRERISIKMKLNENLNNWLCELSNQSEEKKFIPVDYIPDVKSDTIFMESIYKLETIEYNQFMIPSMQEISPHTRYEFFIPMNLFEVSDTTVILFRVFCKDVFKEAKGHRVFLEDDFIRFEKEYSILVPANFSQ